MSVGWQVCHLSNRFQSLNHEKSISHSISNMEIMWKDILSRPAHPMITESFISSSSTDLIPNNIAITAYIPRHNSNKRPNWWNKSSLESKPVIIIMRFIKIIVVHIYNIGYLTLPTGAIRFQTYHQRIQTPPPRLRTSRVMKCPHNFSRSPQPDIINDDIHQNHWCS